MRVVVLVLRVVEQLRIVEQLRFELRFELRLLMPGEVDGRTLIRVTDAARPRLLRSRGTGHEHEGRRVGRRTALAGISSIGLGALLAACGGSGGTSRVTTTTGASAEVSPQAVTTADPATPSTSRACCRP
ncbi:hypothetical protein [Kitasatospora sp. NBC_00315]|uniref:hypothetical protein n=1 Tax=Kitasatospora sp. NBC_00315 TaxID=2975963 RepID=UPI003250A7A9